MTTQATNKRTSISDVFETLASAWITTEQIRNGIGGRSNSASDHPYVATGVDHQGNTIVSGQFVPGVTNGVLLAGVAAVLAIGAVSAALIFD